MSLRELSIPSHTVSVGRLETAWIRCKVGRCTPAGRVHQSVPGRAGRKGGQGGGEARLARAL